MMEVSGTDTQLSDGEKPSSTKLLWTYIPIYARYYKLNGIIVSASLICKHTIGDLI